MLWASMASLFLHIKWRNCLVILAWQKLSAFVCLTVDPHESWCYFEWTQCFSSISSKGNFHEKRCCWTNHCRSEKCSVRDGKSFSSTKFSSINKVLISNMHIFTVWKEQKRAVNLGYIESTVCFLWILFWSKEEINLLMLLTHRMKFSNTDVSI